MPKKQGRTAQQPPADKIRIKRNKAAGHTGSLSVSTTSLIGTYNACTVKAKHQFVGQIPNAVKCMPSEHLLQMLQVAYIYIAQGWIEDRLYKANELYQLEDAICTAYEAMFDDVEDEEGNVETISGYMHIDNELMVYRNHMLDDVPYDLVLEAGYVFKMRKSKIKTVLLRCLYIISHKLYFNGFMDFHDEIEEQLRYDLDERGIDMTDPEAIREREMEIKAINDALEDLKDATRQWTKIFPERTFGIEDVHPDFLIDMLPKGKQYDHLREWIRHIGIWVTNNVDLTDFVPISENEEYYYTVMHTNHIVLFMNDRIHNAIDRHNQMQIENFGTGGNAMQHLFSINRCAKRGYFPRVGSYVNKLFNFDLETLQFRSVWNGRY